MAWPTPAVARATEKRPGLGVQIGQDGGAPGVATVVAMLVLDPSRTVDVASARLIGGRRETAAWLADAMGVLAVSAPRPSPPGPDPAAGDRAGHPRRARPHRLGQRLPPRRSPLAPGARGLGRGVGHQARRRARGAVHAVDGQGAATEGTSWSGAGLLFARLSGNPRVAIAAGPRVRVVGTSVGDAILAPAPGDELTVDADVHLDGRPAGIVLHALPGRVTFTGVSLLVVPGSPAHAVLMVADGSGNETAVSAAVEVPSAPVLHVNAVIKGRLLTATV